MAGINILGVLAEHRRSNGTIQTGYAVYGTDGASPTILARAEGGRILIAEKTVKVIGQMNETFEMQGRVYDKDGLYPAIRAFQGGGVQPKIVEQQKKQDCKVVGALGEKKSNGGTQYYQQDRVYHGDIQPSQSARLPGGSNKFLLEEKHNGFFEEEEGKKTAILPVTENFRIRKLTPRECWRLMGYTDGDFDKAASVNSNSQLYKQAGNAIVKQVLMAIFSQLNIKGVKAWNDMADDERRALIGGKRKEVAANDGRRIREPCR